MNQDIMVSIIVIAFAGLVTVIALLGTRSSRIKKENALREYCASKGWTIDIENGPTKKTTRIVGDNWQIISESIAQNTSDSTGASGWQQNTTWTLKGKGTFPEYVLGKGALPMDADTCPPWIKSALETKLQAEFGFGTEALAQGMLDEPLRHRFLLFAPDRAAERVMNELNALLREWPNAMPLLIRSGKSGVTVILTGHKMNAVTDLTRLVSIGLASAGV